MRRSPTVSNDETRDYVTVPYQDLDEDQLRKALESASSLDERIKIRSALRKLKDGRRVERKVGINPTRREERHEDVNGTNLDGFSETSSKSPSAYETASEPDTFSLPDTLSEPDLAESSTPETDGKESPLSTASSSSNRSVKNDDKYQHITDSGQLEDLLRRTVDYYEKKRIRAQLNALKKEKGRVDIQRKKSRDYGRNFSNEELNNIRNSLDVDETTKMQNEAEERDEEIVKRLTNAAKQQVIEKHTDSQDDSDKEFTESLELSLKSLEREFDECKDFDKRRQIRLTIKELRTKIRDHKRKVIERKGSNSLTDQSQTVHIEKDISMDDGHGHVSVKVSKVQIPSQSTITEKVTVVQTERKTSDGEVFKEHSKVTTKEKLSRSGSNYYETDAVNKKTVITESGGEEEEVDVYVEKGSKSVSKGESHKEAANAKIIPKNVDKRLRSRVNKDAPTSTSSSDSDSNSAPMEKDPNYGIPEVVEPLCDQTVVGGDSVELSCRVDVKSDLMLTIKWYRGHNLLEHSEDFYQVFDGRRARLKIPYCEVEDEGVYSCVIRTRYGRAETKATLKIEKNTVKPVPKITLPLVDKTVTDGTKSVTLECCLTSQGEIDLCWYKDGKQLPSDSDFKQMYDGQVAQLVIDEVFTEDSGHYKVIAKNSSGEVSSECDLSVTANMDPPSFDKELNDITVEEGNRVTLEVWLRGKPKPTVKWYYNDEERTNTMDFKQTYRGSVARLIIREIQEDHSGTYTCVATNDAGECSTSSQVTAKNPQKRNAKKPVISKALTDTDALDGDDIVFSCEVTGDPEPTISWFRDSEELDKESKDYVQNYDGCVATLRIDDIMTDDSADIKMVAENSEGKTESSCRLEVKDISPDLTKESNEDIPESNKKDNKKPVFTMPLKDYTFIDGQPALLQCELDTSSDTDVIWYKNGRELPNNSEFGQKFDGKIAKLDILEVFPDDAGDYTCEAENDHGVTKVSCTVNIIEEEDEDEESKEEAMSAPDINSMEDEDELHKLMQKTEDFEERKKIRARMKEVREKKAGRDLVGKHQNPGSVEESSSTSTKTETGQDGSKTTTTTTTTTKKSTDGSTIVTKQSKQVTKVGGLGNTTYNINKASAESTAKNLAKTMSGAGNLGTTGFVNVKTESWTSKDGIARRSEKSQSWGPGPAGRGAARPNMLRVVPVMKEFVKKSYISQKNAVELKQELLEFCRKHTSGYEHCNITNFSSSWNDGMAFCALIHSFCPKFEYDKLDPKRRRANFTLAFKVAEIEAGISPLLDVDDMVRMKNPDWKCVFTYVQSFYRRFRLQEEKNPGSPVTPTTPKTPLSPEPTMP